jgi:hypothetical protein
MEAGETRQGGAKRSRLDELKKETAALKADAHLTERLHGVQISTEDNMRAWQGTLDKANKQEIQPLFISALALTATAAEYWQDLSERKNLLDNQLEALKEEVHNRDAKGVVSKLFGDRFRNVKSSHLVNLEGEFKRIDDLIALLDGMKKTGRQAMEQFLPRLSSIEGTSAGLTTAGGDSHNGTAVDGRIRDAREWVRISYGDVSGTFFDIERDLTRARKSVTNRSSVGGPSLSDNPGDNLSATHFSWPGGEQNVGVRRSSQSSGCEQSPPASEPMTESQRIAAAYRAEEQRKSAVTPRPDSSGIRNQ